MLKRPGPTLADLSKANMMINVCNSKRLQPSAKTVASACNVPLGYLKCCCCVQRKACICKRFTGAETDVYIVLSLWQYMLTLRLSRLV